MQEYIVNNLNTKFLGRKIIYFDSIESTHIFAKKLKVRDLVDGMIILANNQTGGIGTHDRKWYTGQGMNLSFNIVLLPNCEVRKISRLTVIIAECIKRVLNDLYSIETQIKKPNDIMLNGKKMAGILTESTAIGDIVKRIYIGIGINVNQESFPGNLDLIATSLKKEYRKDFRREQILLNFLEIFEKEYEKILK